MSAAPALQLGAEHDVQSERYALWYAGGFTSPILVEGRTRGELVAYAGLAMRRDSVRVFYWPA